jgi:hypothetical protein
MALLFLTNLSLTAAEEPSFFGRFLKLFSEEEPTVNQTGYQLPSMTEMPLKEEEAIELKDLEISEPPKKDRLNFEEVRMLQEKIKKENTRKRSKPITITTPTQKESGTCELENSPYNNLEEISEKEIEINNYTPLHLEILLSNQKFGSRTIYLAPDKTEKITIQDNAIGFSAFPRWSLSVNYVTNKRARSSMLENDNLQLLKTKLKIQVNIYIDTQGTLRIETP